jgi:CoA:oxalate CoA-transferase
MKMNSIMQNDIANSRARAAGPLAGIRVVDLSRIYSGPYATCLMAMAGAEVVKVEPPEGESLRGRNARPGAGLPFAMLNPNKRSVTLNLKADAAKALLEDLLKTADVLVENFRPGVLARLGFDDAALAGLNPRLIRASISGYGSEGPYRDFPAMDLTIQAASGILDSTGYPDQPPVKSGAAIADFSAGVHLYGAIVTALLHRERTGQVTHTEVAMLDAVYPTLCSNFGLAMGGEGAFQRTGNRHGGLSLCPYNVYPAADGYVAIICNNNDHWLRLLKVLGREHDLGATPAYATMSGRVGDMERIDGEIGAETARLSRDALFARLNAGGVPCGPVRTLPEVMADPHLRERGMLQTVQHAVYGELVLCHSPLRFERHPPIAYQPSAILGADNEGIFCGELGLEPARLAALKREGVL